MVTASAMSLTPRIFIHSAVRITDIKSFPSTRYASKTRKEKLSGPGETCQNNVSERHWIFHFHPNALDSVEYSTYQPDVSSFHSSLLLSSYSFLLFRPAVHSTSANPACPKCRNRGPTVRTDPVLKCIIQLIFDVQSLNDASMQRQSRTMFHDS